LPLGSGVSGPKSRSGPEIRKPQTVPNAEDFGRVRLSRSFFMRDFLYREIASICGITNRPDDPELAIEAGRELCEHLLEPCRRPSAAWRSGRRTARRR
jgi:hypothetical protein